jgi:glycosyltransferase involved in cell wall biosynthesis
LKILIDGRLIADKETGISRYSEELLKIYKELFGAENITLIVSINLKKEFSGIDVIKTELYPFNIIHFMKFHRILKTIDFDVYHSMFYANSFFKVKNKIYISTVHDLMYRVVPNFFRKNMIINQLAIWYFDFIVKQSLKNSDYIVAISNATQKDIKSIFGLKSVVITEGINELHSDNENLEIDTSKLKTKEFFLYVGNNRPHKNVEFLKSCYMKSSSRKKLVIVGHKGEDISIDNKEIIYTGYINDFTLKYLYSNASAFVFPSFYEGFGLPILEAIYLDTLVLSSSSGSLSEFGEYNIQYFDPKKEENLIKLLENIDNTKFDYHKKKILLDRFNWKVVKNQLQKFYKDEVFND